MLRRILLVSILCFCAAVSVSAQPKAGSGSRGQGPRQQEVTFAHKGEFSVITVGTGSPTFDWNRAGACVLVHNQGEYALVDMGRFAQLRLLQMGVPLANIGAMLFTHHHMDHNESFAPVFLKSRMQGGARLVAGPPGTVRFADFLVDFYEQDIRYRQGNQGAAGERAWNRFTTFERFDMSGGESFTFGGMRISSAAVSHSIHTNALRFDSDGKSIVISGDTMYSKSLVQLARGADILILDGSRSEAPEGLDRRSARTPAHASPEELVRMADEAGVRKVVLTHFGPRFVNENKVRRAFARDFHGDVVFGTDMMEIVP